MALDWITLLSAFSGGVAGSASQYVFNAFSKSQDARLASDIELFKRVQQLCTPQWEKRFVHQHDFGNPFSTRDLEPIDGMVEEFDGRYDKFHNSKLNNSFGKLRTLCIEFRAMTGSIVFTVGNGERLQVMPNSFNEDNDGCKTFTSEREAAIESLHTWCATFDAEYETFMERAKVVLRL